MPVFPLNTLQGMLDYSKDGHGWFYLSSSNPLSAQKYASTGKGYSILLP